MINYFILLSCFRYEEFSDAVVLLAKIGIYTKDDEMIVTRKAKAILKCFIDSQVPPRIQVSGFIISFPFFTPSDKSGVGMIGIGMKDYAAIVHPVHHAHRNISMIMLFQYFSSVLLTSSSCWSLVSRLVLTSDACL